MYGHPNSEFYERDFFIELCFRGLASKTILLCMHQEK